MMASLSGIVDCVDFIVLLFCCCSTTQKCIVTILHSSIQIDCSVLNYNLYIIIMTLDLIKRIQNFIIENDAQFLFLCFDKGL